MLDVNIYIGKQTEKNKKRKNVGENVVLDLAVPYFFTQRVITCDNFFTSIGLAQNLWKNGVMLVGTMRVNKPEIPIEFKPQKSRKIFSSIYGHNNYLTLVSYVPKEKKCVILLTSKHQTVEFEKGDKKKPDVIQFYNKTKGGVDTFDKLISHHSCTRKTNRWPLRFFMFLIDSAVQNSVTMYLQKERDQGIEISNVDRRKAIETLALDLTKTYILTRFENFKEQNFTGLQNDLRDCFRKTGLFDESEFLKTTEKSPTNLNFIQTRCYMCPRSSDVKTRNDCAVCGYYFCMKHSKKMFMCNSCFNDLKKANEDHTRKNNDSLYLNLRSKKQ